MHRYHVCSCCMFVCVCVCACLASRMGLFGKKKKQVEEDEFDGDEGSDDDVGKKSGNRTARGGKQAEDEVLSMCMHYMCVCACVSVCVYLSACRLKIWSVWVSVCCACCLFLFIIVSNDVQYISCIHVLFGVLTYMDEICVCVHVCCIFRTYMHLLGLYISTCLSLFTKQPQKQHAFSPRSPHTHRSKRIHKNLRKKDGLVNAKTKNTRKLVRMIRHTVRHAHTRTTHLISYTHTVICQKLAGVRVCIKVCMYTCMCRQPPTHTDIHIDKTKKIVHELI
jgi:hypothetical protein